MGYLNLRQCVEDLQRAGQLIAIDEEIDAHLEAAEIHRRVFRSGGPALLFSRVRGCRFPMASNLFGTLDRAQFMFRDTIESVRRLIELKLDSGQMMKRPGRYWKAPWTALHMLPRRARRGPVLQCSTTIDQLPHQQSWPDDGGPFVTLPLVYSEDVERPGFLQSNLGMYRVQLSGGQYKTNEEVGLHYQIHRGIGVHHTTAIRQRKPLRVNIHIGGTPAMMLAAVMPLPEGMSELTFAGALAGHRIKMIAGAADQLPVYAEADFCIRGVVDPDRKLPEGPFGDHLGYYSLAHPFPVLRVKEVLHRPEPIWAFTVVGRPPQEDTVFGQLIHDITGPVIPTVIRGVHAVHAVDTAGVHPLMLAIGSERYTPYQQVQRPQELLTQANAILGQGQMSLAKYLLIVARDDDPALDIHDIEGFFRHLLARADWTRDLHFQTRTTIDTLDYSGTGLNEGSKVVIAAAGPVRRELPVEVPGDAWLPAGFANPRVCMPGVLAVESPKFTAAGDGALARFSGAFSPGDWINRVPKIVLVDDSDFTSRFLNNFLWVVFTRSDPAADIDGIAAFTEQKHWGCRGSLVVDARSKPHHAPPLSEDPAVSRRVDALAARGGPLAKYL